MPLKFNPFTGTLDYTVSAAVEEKAKGIPEGGGTSTVLMKKSAINYDDEWALLANANVKAAAGIEESKLSLPEMVKKTGAQEITGTKTFANIQGTTNIKGEVNAVIEAFKLVKSKEVSAEEVKVSKELNLAGGSLFSLNTYFTLPAAGAQELLANTNDFKFAVANTTQGLAAVAAGVTLSGCAIAAQAEGGKSWQLLVIANVPTIEAGFGGNITLLNENVGSKVKNRFKLAETEVVVKLNQFVWFFYNPEINLWQQFTSPEELTAGEGLEVAARKMKIKALGITEGMLGAEVASKGKLAKAVQEELLTVAAFPAPAAYTSAKEETETKPTFITLVIKTKAEAAKAIVKLVNDASEVVYEWDALVAGAQKLPVTFLVKKGGKWKATLETAAESATISRQVINSV